MTSRYQHHDKENSVLKNLQEQALKLTDAYFIEYPDLDAQLTREAIHSKILIKLCEACKKEDLLKTELVLEKNSAGMEQMTGLLNLSANGKHEFQYISITSYLFIDGSMVTQSRGYMPSDGETETDTITILTASVSILTKGGQILSQTSENGNDAPMPVNIIVQLQDQFSDGELRNIKEHLIAESVIDAVGASKFTEKTKPAVNKIISRSAKSSSICAFLTFLKYQKLDPSRFLRTINKAEKDLLKEGRITKNDTYAESSKIEHSKLAFSCVELHLQDETEAKFKFKAAAT